MGVVEWSGGGGADEGEEVYGGEKERLWSPESEMGGHGMIMMEMWSQLAGHGMMWISMIEAHRCGDGGLRSNERRIFESSRRRDEGEGRSVNTVREQERVGASFLFLYARRLGNDQYESVLICCMKSHHAS